MLLGLLTGWRAEEAPSLQAVLAHAGAHPGHARLMDKVAFAHAAPRHAVSGCAESQRIVALDRRHSELPCAIDFASQSSTTPGCSGDG